MAKGGGIEHSALVFGEGLVMVGSEGARADRSDRANSLEHQRACAASSRRSPPRHRPGDGHRVRGAVPIEGRDLMGIERREREYSVSLRVSCF